MNESDMKAIQDSFFVLRSFSVGLLTTFRRSGQGVATPVGIKSAAGKVYFTTWSTTGKVKRLANNPHVTLAPCTRRGKVLGPTVEAVSRRLEGTEAAHIKSTLLKKSIWGQLWDLIYRLRGWQPVLYELSPVRTELTAGASSVNRKGVVDASKNAQ